MKQILIAFGISMIAVSALSSCKKTYSCSCTSTISVNDSVMSVNMTKTDYKVTKNGIKNKCADWTQVSIAYGDTTKTVTDCSFE